DILAEDLRKTRGRTFAGGIARIKHAEVIAGPADRIEHRLARRQESETVRPTVIVRRAVRILFRQMQIVRSAVGRTRAAFVGTVLADDHAAGEWMIVGRKTDGITVAVSPRERLDRVRRKRRVQPCAQDGTVADAMMRCTLERFHGGARACRAKRRIPAGRHSAAGVEYILAQHDVLARDILLVLTPAVVAAYYAAVGGRSLRPVDPVIVERQLLGGVVAGGQRGDERGDLSRHRVYRHDARAV